MSKRSLLTSFALLTCVFALIVGCPTVAPSGGGSSTPPPPPPGGGITRFDRLPDKSATPPGLENFTLRTKWQKQEITYFITSFTPDLSQESQRQVFARALDAWRAQIPLEFREVFSAGEADMVFGFGEGDHCELYQVVLPVCPADAGIGFDGLGNSEGNVLAHCYFPPGSGGATPGDCHYDDAETWTADDTSTAETRLFEVAKHELGHGLGLGHSDDPNASMFPSYNANVPKSQLGGDDIAGIQQLYGARDPNDKVTPATPVRPKSPDADEVPVDPTAPTTADTDGDGLVDDIELFLVGTDPDNFDTDGDGLADSEVLFGLNPLHPDTDGDGLNDGEELLNGTDPFTPDFGGGAAFAGTYFGQDDFGSYIDFKIEADGSATGTFSIVTYGFYYDADLIGGVDNLGNLLLVSYDYIFAFTGTIAGGSVDDGILEVFGPEGAGAVLGWTASIEGGFTDCDDSCKYAGDFECDDGRPGAVTNLCYPGTDCSDCEGFIGPVECEDSCEYAFDGECDDGRAGAVSDFCFPNSDCCDCDGPCGGGGFDCDDSCEYAFDGECDDGRPGAVTDFCFPGSDCCDCDGECGGGFVCDDSCVFAGDGECDDFELGGTGACPTGTDCFDCSGGGFACDDSCEFAGDGECDDFELGGTGACPTGTDCFDCSGGGFACDNSCELAFDGFCDDEFFGGFCLFNTDCFDCGPLDGGFKRAAHKRFSAKHGVAKRETRFKRPPSKVQAASRTNDGKVRGRAKSDLYFPVPSKRVPLTSPVHYRVDWKSAKRAAVNP